MTIKQKQHLLAYLGYYTGGVGGLWGQVPAGHGGYIETLSAE